MDTIEYRVCPVPRYVVRRYVKGVESPSMTTVPAIAPHAYETAHAAFVAAYGMTEAERQRLGYPPGDKRLKYPEEIMPDKPVKAAKPMTALNDPQPWTPPKADPVPEPKPMPEPKPPMKEPAPVIARQPVTPMPEPKPIHMTPEPKPAVNPKPKFIKF